MLWDCGSCGTRKLLGKTHRRCPNCGAAQNAKARYFPKKGEEVAVEGHVFVGVDWGCSACQTPNSQAALFCVNCGTPRDGNAAVPLVPDEMREARAVPEDPSPPRLGLSREGEPTAGRGFWKSTMARMAAGLSTALATFMAVALLWTRPVPVAIERHDWTREIDIERMAARAESEWCSAMPGDAYGVSRSREVREHRQIADGEECHDSRSDNGDGTFSTSRECTTKYRSEPVYDDRCHFTVNRWGVSRTEKTTRLIFGPEPVWPAVRVSGGTCLGCEREGPRRETLSVDLRGRADQGKTWRCDIDNGRWRALKNGDERQIEVRVLTGGAVCDTLKP